jgi:hypothetical protein
MRDSASAASRSTTATASSRCPDTGLNVPECSCRACFLQNDAGGGRGERSVQKGTNVNQDKWHIYRNNRASERRRGEFMGVRRGALQGSIAQGELAAWLGEGEFIAVFAGSYPKSSGVPPVKFISVVTSDVEVTVR